MRLLLLALIGCGAPAAQPATHMPLPGETAASSTAHEPDFRVDPDDHPGKLTEDEIDAVMQHLHPSIVGCYEQVLAVAPEVAGVAQTVIVIDRDGKVLAAASSGVEPRLGRCIDGVVGRSQFPPPHGGTLKIRYPFTFHAATDREATDPTTTVTDGKRERTAPTTSSRVTCGRRK